MKRYISISPINLILTCRSCKRKGTIVLTTFKNSMKCYKNLVCTCNISRHRQPIAWSYPFFCTCTYSSFNIYVSIHKLKLNYKHLQKLFLLLSLHLAELNQSMYKPHHSFLKSKCHSLKLAQ